VKSARWLCLAQQTEKGSGSEATLAEEQKLESQEAAGIQEATPAEHIPESSASGREGTEAAKPVRTIPRLCAQLFRIGSLVTRWLARLQDRISSSVGHGKRFLWGFKATVPRQEGQKDCIQVPLKMGEGGNRRNVRNCFKLFVAVAQELELSEIQKLQIQQLGDLRQAAKEAAAPENFWVGVAEEVKLIEWPNLGEVRGGPTHHVADLSILCRAAK
jgi:hypothetical protein